MSLLCSITCTSTFFDHSVPVVSLNQNRTSPLRCDQLILLVDAFPSHKVAMFWPHLTNPLQKLPLCLLLCFAALRLIQELTKPLHDCMCVSAWLSANDHYRSHVDYKNQVKKLNVLRSTTRSM